MIERIGDYKVLSELGRGGMGLVLKAYDESLKRNVAIKVLSEELTRDQSFTTRFIREAQSAAQLSHPNITQIYYIGKDQARHFFVMEFVEGQSLLQLVRREGKLDCERAAGYILQAAHGLAAAHDLGVIHRDIKPANLMVAKNGVVKIADFGLAVMPSDAARLTSTGMLMGTPGYISPEQCMGEEADARTDIYSLGVSFYELLAGTIPFQADSPIALIRQVCDVMPRDISQFNPDVDDECKSILQKMMAKTRDKRHQNCHELVVALEDYLGAPSVVSGAARPTRRIAGAAAVVGAVAAKSAGTPIPTPLDGPPTEVLPVTARSRTPVATDLDGPPTAVLGTRSGAALRDPHAQALTGRGEQRPVERSVIIPAEIMTGVEISPSRRNARTAVIGVAVFALGFAGFAMWRSNNRERPSLGMGTPSDSQAALIPPVPPAAGGEYAASSQPERSYPMVASNGNSQPEAADSATGEPAAMGVPAQATAPAGTDGQTANQLAANQAGYPITQPPTTHPTDAPAQLASSPTNSAGRPAPRVAANHSPAAGNPSAAKGTAANSYPAMARPAAAAVAAPVPQATPDLPLKPVVAVIARGERMLSRTLEEHIERVLGVASIKLFDEGNDPALGDLLSATGHEASFSQLQPKLQDANVSVVVLIAVEPMGERTLSYLGRSENSLTSKVKVNVFRVPDRKALGQGWSDTLEYTPLKAKRVAEGFADKKGDAIALAIRNGWTEYRAR